MVGARPLSQEDKSWLQKYNLDADFKEYDDGRIINVNPIKEILGQILTMSNYTLLIHIGSFKS